MTKYDSVYYELRKKYYWRLRERFVRLQQRTNPSFEIAGMSNHLMMGSKYLDPIIERFRRRYDV